MKSNHIPRAERLRQRISKLSYIEEGIMVKSQNIYPKCRECGIHIPQIVDGKHFKNCSLQGIYKQIVYYKNLLKEEIL